MHRVLKQAPVQFSEEGEEVVENTGKSYKS